MKFLFLHPNFPSQFRDLAAFLARDKRHQVVFITERAEGELPGVHKLVYKKVRPPGKATHPYLVGFEQTVLHGQQAYRVGLELKKRGFVPDVIYGHSGFGPTLFMKDLFPQSKLLCQFEWFYHAHGTDADFDRAEPLTPDDEARIRIKNASILIDLHACDAGSCPTHWQKRQFPAEFQSKLHICHEGIDTDYFKPEPARLVLPRLGLDLSEVKEVVTYVSRGLESYRGFPQFIESMQQLLEARPQCHVVIVGDDRVAYGRKLPNGKTYKEAMLEKFPLDSARVHFTGLIPYTEYRQVLRASSAHVYLTRPFVLSWSLLEAMATGCLVVASNTEPVREVIEDGANGMLVDFFSPEAITRRVSEALDSNGDLTSLRDNARATVRHRYALRDLLPERLRWIGRHTPRRTTFVRPAKP
ncbi:MAG: glycosyltransferase [Chthoniobacterales bacterium]